MVVEQAIWPSRQLAPKMLLTEQLRLAAVAIARPRDGQD
jgi:hypothetical protein